MKDERLLAAERSRQRDPRPQSRLPESLGEDIPGPVLKVSARGFFVGY
jgi:hypothetical protein